MKTEAEMERFIGRHSRGILEPGKDGRGKKKKKKSPRAFKGGIGLPLP